MVSQLPRTAQPWALKNLPPFRPVAAKLFWKYNLATAAICEWLAGLLAIQPDAGYTAGLIHDIGRLGILRAHPEEYERMLSMIEEYGFDLLRCEKDLFDIDHCEAGRYLL